MTGLFLKIIDETVFYYDGVSELNENLRVDDIKLMMPMSEVRDILGKEELKDEGLLWNDYEYPSRKIYISTSSPKSYDLYNKVNGITIRDNQYSVYGISIDTKMSKASKILQDKGYSVEEQFGFLKVYRKGCISIFMYGPDDSIMEIAISIEDKYFNPDFIMSKGIEKKLDKIIELKKKNEN